MKLALLLALCALATPEPRALWLRQADESHQAADRALAMKQPQAAREALLRFLEAAPPAGIRSDDARSVQQDAWFHLASVELQSGDAKRAQADAEKGLTLGRETDLFTANLLVVRGRARELQQDDRGAISDYQEAMRINEALLKAASEGGR